MKSISWAALFTVSAGLFLGAAEPLLADDNLGVSGFTAVYFSLSGGEYTASGTAVISGGTFLKGGPYDMSDGILNASEAPALTLKDAHVYPNPCSIKQGCLALKFTKITVSAELKIYTMSGELVWSYNKNNSDNSITWNLRNTKGSEVASGLYIYYISTQGSSKKGKLILIR